MTILNISDSSGAYTARILKVYKRTGILVPKVGEIFTISVKTARSGILFKNKAKRKSTCLEKCTRKLAELISIVTHVCLEKNINYLFF